MESLEILLFHLPLYSVFAIVLLSVTYAILIILCEVNVLSESHWEKISKILEYMVAIAGLMMAISILINDELTIQTFHDRLKTYDVEIYVKGKNNQYIKIGKNLRKYYIKKLLSAPRSHFTNCDAPRRNPFVIVINQMKKYCYYILEAGIGWKDYTTLFYYGCYTNSISLGHLTNLKMVSCVNIDTDDQLMP